MKKFFLVLAVLLALAVCAIGMFLATFDIDRYRPLLVAELQRQLGKPVSLEHIALGWHNGIALRAQGLTISNDAQTMSDPFLAVESASALVHLGPLLRKEVQISSVILVRPQVHLTRDAQGRVNALGLAVAAGPAAAVHPAASGKTGGVSFAVDAFRIADGTLHWTDATVSPPSDLWIRSLDASITDIAPGRPMMFEAAGAFASSQPNVRFRGRLVPPDGSRAGSLEQLSVSVDRLPLENALPAAPPGAPSLHGLLTASVQGTVPTLDPAQALQALSGQGTIRLDEAKVVNLNIMREAFNRLSMLPELVERLEARLSEADRAKLSVKDTVLAPVELPIRMEQGLMRLERLDLRTDTVGLTGSGTVGVAGGINLQLMLRIDPALSAALIRSVNELQPLANASGEMEIPLTIQGQAPQLAVIPDVKYVASKVIVNKVIDLIGGLLEARRESDQPQPPQEGSAQETAPQRSTPPSDPLGQFLHRALERYAPTEPSAPATTTP